MALPEPLRETLLEVAVVMRAAEDPWWLIGSAAVALLGAEPVTVADVDVLLSDADAVRVFAALGLERRAGAPHALFRSTMLAGWERPPYKVEFMSGLQVNTAGGWVAVAPETREAVELGPVTLYTPSRRELRQILLAFGRAKDHERAALLAD